MRKFMSTIFIYSFILIGIFIILPKNNVFAQVNMSSVNVTSINLDKSEMILKLGESEKLKATISPENASNKEVIWNSSNENIVQVDLNGLVTGLKPGSAVVVVTAKDGLKTEFCNVVVKEKEVSVTGISLDKSDLNIQVGERCGVKATVYPYNASNKEVVWESSDPDIVKVNSFGNITGVKEGNAVVMATTKDGLKTAFCNVDVNMDWKELGTKLNVPVYKEWTIKFNMNINSDTVNENSVYVIDYYGNRKNDIKVFLAESKEVKVRPIEDYEPDMMYYLYINQNIESIDGKRLAKGIKMPFLIKD